MKLRGSHWRDWGGRQEGRLKLPQRLKFSFRGSEMLGFGSSGNGSLLLASHSCLQGLPCVLLRRRRKGSHGARQLASRFSFSTPIQTPCHSNTPMECRQDRQMDGHNDTHSSGTLAFLFCLFLRKRREKGPVSCALSTWAWQANNSSRNMFQRRTAAAITTKTLGTCCHQSPATGGLQELEDTLCSKN